MKWFIMSSNDKSNLVNREEFNKLIDKYVGNKVTVNEKCFDEYCLLYATTSGEAPIVFALDNLIILGDIEIHNRADLMNKYRSIVISDEDINVFYKMYCEKGIDCINDIVGDFSLIVIDIHNNMNYAVRDQLGKRTLFYASIDSQYFITSDLFLLKGIIKNCRLNTDYFIEYYDRNGSLDSCFTPYENIYRIPSGHFVRIQNREFIMNEYWCLTKNKNQNSKMKEEEYVEAFYDILKNSVEDRIQNHQKSAVMLSGGLDSTSVYAIAKLFEEKNNVKVSSVSAVFDELYESDERDFIVPLLEKYDDEGLFVNYDDNLMFENIPFNAPYSYEPSVDLLTYEFTNKTIEEIVQKGYLNIVTGFGGDHLLSGTLFMTRDFLKRGKVKKALSYLTHYAITTNRSAVDYLKEYTLFPDIAVYHSIDKETDYYYEIENKFKNIKYYHQKELYIQLLNTKPHYIDRVLGGIANATIHHPFLDRRLIEFVYNLPPELRLSMDANKYILRESMRELLTDRIVNNLNKATHDAHTFKSIVQNWNTIYKRFSEPLLIGELNLITKDDWNRMLIQWRNGLDVGDKFWTLLSIEVWYKKYLYEFIKG